MRIRPAIAVAAGALVLIAAACRPGSGGARSLTVYSGRSDKLVGPLFERFTEATGITVKARYGETAEMAAQIAEEGRNTRADLFFAQDAGALGALQASGIFERLPADLVDRVPPRYRSDAGDWTGTSGRVRVVAFNPSLVERSELPGSILGFAAPRWKGVVGWAPTNGSFQVFLTGLRRLRGEDTARRWLEAMKANGARTYPNNDAIAAAIAEGEIEVGFVNHYYPLEIREEIPGAKVENHFLRAGDPGGLVNVAGVGIVRTSERKALARRLVDYLLSDAGQRYFVTRTFEYPLVPGIAGDPRLPSLESLEPPDVNLSDLSDLDGTLRLLQEVGLL